MIDKTTRNASGFLYPLRKLRAESPKQKSTIYSGGSQYKEFHLKIQKVYY
jgi:hypothetical protein